MSYRIESSVTIMAPPEAVWTTIQDVSRRIEWDARVVSAELQTPGPVGKGSRLRVNLGMFGVTTGIDMEMIVWEPTRKSAVRGVMVSTQDRIAGSWHFTTNPDGSTTWTTKLMLIGKGRFGRIREWINGPITKRLTIISQYNLKRLIEAEHAAGDERGRAITEETLVAR